MEKWTFAQSLRLSIFNSSGTRFPNKTNRGIPFNTGECTPLIPSDHLSILGFLFTENSDSSAHKIGVVAKARRTIDFITRVATRGRPMVFHTLGASLVPLLLEYCHAVLSPAHLHLCSIAHRVKFVRCLRALPTNSTPHGENIFSGSPESRDEESRESSFGESLVRRWAPQQRVRTALVFFCGRTFLLNKTNRFYPLPLDTSCPYRWLLPALYQHRTRSALKFVVYLRIKCHWACSYLPPIRFPIIFIIITSVLF